MDKAGQKQQFSHLKRKKPSVSARVLGVGRSQGYLNRWARGNAGSLGLVGLSPRAIERLG